MAVHKMTVHKMAVHKMHCDMRHICLLGMVFTLLYFSKFLIDGACSFLSPAEELHKEMRCGVV
jgi:hypothetical protein